MISADLPALYGVDAAIDVQHLPGRHGEQVAEEGEARLGDDFGVVHIPSEWGSLGPGVLEGRESGDGLCRHGAYRAGGHQVDPDAVGARSRAR